MKTWIVTKIKNLNMTKLTTEKATQLKNPNYKKKSKTENSDKNLKLK